MIDEHDPHRDRELLARAAAIWMSVGQENKLQELLQLLPADRLLELRPKLRRGNPTLTEFMAEARRADDAGEILFVCVLGADAWWASFSSSLELKRYLSRTLNAARKYGPGKLEPDP